MFMEKGLGGLKDFVCGMKGVVGCIGCGMKTWYCGMKVKYTLKYT